MSDHERPCSSARSLSLALDLSYSSRSCSDCRLLLCLWTLLAGSWATRLRQSYEADACRSCPGHAWPCDRLLIHPHVCSYSSILKANDRHDMVKHVRAAAAKDAGYTVQCPSIRKWGPRGPLGTGDPGPLENGQEIPAGGPRPGATRAPLGAPAGAL